MLRFLAPMLLACAAVPNVASAQITEQSLFRPAKAGELTAEALAQVLPKAKLERHTVRAQDGTRLSAVLIRNPGASTTILYFGGNQFTKGQYGAQVAGLLGKYGSNLMLVDHRGYGLSEGSPSVAALMSDGLTTYDYLSRLRGVNRKKIVVHGQSLGSYVAGHVAAQRPAAAAVLESTITTAEDWAKLVFGGRPMVIEPALQGQGNQRNIRLIQEPLLILVGAADRLAPPALSESLYSQSPLSGDRKQLVIAKGAGHNDALKSPEAQEAYRALLAKLSK